MSVSTGGVTSEGLQAAAAPPAVRLSLPWLHSAPLDLTLLIAPGLVSALAVVALPDVFQAGQGVSPVLWLILVLGIDVAHVWSTLYRTYLDPLERERRSAMLVAVPLLAWAAGVVLHSIKPMLFWRVLAYLAVFHFVRQQYGFFSLYASRERLPRWEARLGGVAIYLAPLYPLTYWHLSPPRELAWLVEGDFVTTTSPSLARVAGWLFVAVMAVYAANELRRARSGMAVNVPKNLLLLSTAASWYVGIVLTDYDLAFTLTNVVAHGVPYLALVWVAGRGRWNGVPSAGGWSWLYRPRWLVLFLGVPLLAAYFEEALWAYLVWNERLSLFPALGLSPVVERAALSMLVPLLAVPQATHYVLDAFLWRRSRGEVLPQLTA